ncbi:3-isopropylmalate dehydratase large subunit, chloroplastic-like [Lactuca sativa]|uniref:3-isopropylmalate dehydratase large subunit, chloroplastic-like n=1 Tax=Lactuca sativa TaxID=4236 RepID=UPI000CD8E599|nr:3-isopropylmalate dehydratase large subunit, chloroplastic-like [Lactuca sativa]
MTQNQMTQKENQINAVIRNEALLLLTYFTREAEGCLELLTNLIRNNASNQANTDYKGVCHVDLAQGQCIPREVLLGIDSYTFIAGAFGQLATRIKNINTDAIFVLGTGKLLLKVPPTLGFVLDGEMPDYLLAKDLILQIIGERSISGATYKAMEFVYSTIESLTRHFWKKIGLFGASILAGTEAYIIYV